MLSQESTFQIRITTQSMQPAVPMPQFFRLEETQVLGRHLSGDHSAGANTMPTTCSLSVAWNVSSVMRYMPRWSLRSISNCSQMLSRMEQNLGTLAPHGLHRPLANLEQLPSRSMYLLPNSCGTHSEFSTHPVGFCRGCAAGVSWPYCH